MPSVDEAGKVQLGTRWPVLWAALSAEFHPDDVKSRKGQGSGPPVRYITARTVMNRLDEVFGPEAWWDRYVPGENSVICELSVTMPDGEVITKCDAGGHAGMSDQGDDEKSAFSDALKRAAVRFGVGRYLYRDGMTSFGEGPTPEATPVPATNGHAPTAPEPNDRPRSGKALFKCVKDLEEANQVELIKPLNAFLKSRSITERMTDFDAGMIATAWDWVTDRLASLTSPPTSAPPAAPANGHAKAVTDPVPPELAKLRGEFVTLARTIDAGVHGDHSNQATLKDEVARIADMAKPGWQVLSLRDLEDPAAFRLLIETAKRRLQEVEDIPF